MVALRRSSSVFPFSCGTPRWYCPSFGVVLCCRENAGRLTIWRTIAPSSFPVSENGTVSARFCSAWQTQGFDGGLVIPTSAAILHDLAGYDAALEDFSTRILPWVDYTIDDTEL